VGKANPNRFGRSAERSVLAKKNKIKQDRIAVFHRSFREDLKYWVETERSTALRALTIVEETMRDPFSGIGKPEPLRYELAGAWSRRLTREHRIVYLVSDERITFLEARYHY
jgi:toxin YoeB